MAGGGKGEGTERTRRVVKGMRRWKKEVKGRAERVREGGRLKLSYRPTDKHTRATQ